MFDFVLSLPFLVGLVLGALIGVGLGRRSKTANEYYDRARAAWDLREAQLQAKIDELKAKYGEK
jgi:hypothetical protein